MAEELGTKDVLEQVDTRLSNVEQDMREFRSEVNGRFDQANREMNDRFNRLEGKHDGTTRWLVGLVLLSWLSLVVSVWLKA